MLTLPACHTDQELALARSIARELDSEDLHVFWSERLLLGAAAVREPSAVSGAALAFAAIGALVDALATALAPKGRTAA
jgi:hypothetical protein